LLDHVQTYYGTVQNLDYEWYPSGSLASRTNNINSKVETFTYDALNRLLTHNVNGGQALSLGYYADGNIQSKSDVGSYGYGGAAGGAHAVTSIGGVPRYAYDGNGNMTDRDGDTITGGRITCRRRSSTALRVRRSFGTARTARATSKSPSAAARRSRRATSAVTSRSSSAALSRSTVITSSPTASYPSRSTSAAPTTPRR
jgi:YD repeat-containing protein